MAYVKTDFCLSRLLQYAYRELGQMVISTAAGTCTTTIIEDSKMADIYGDDELKDGCAFIIEDSAGAGAGPEGEYQRISANAQSDGSITVDTAFTAAPATGDTYGFVSNFYPHYMMVQLANDGIRELGDLYLIDTTTLDTASSQTEYTYEHEWGRSEPLRVEVQGRIGDANDNKWYELNDWEYRPATAGSDGLLVIFGQLPAGRDLAIHYYGPHPLLNTYEDPIAECIHPTLATKMLVVKALEWQNRRLQGGDPFLLQSLNDARGQLEYIKSLYPVYRPKRKPQLFTIGRYPGVDEFKEPDE